MPTTYSDKNTVFTHIESPSDTRRKLSTPDIAKKLISALRGVDACRQVHTVGPAITAASSDFGRIARGHPQVVVVARTVQDVCDVLRVANDLSVQVTPRGNGGTTYGQTVTNHGIVLDLRSLKSIHFPRSNENDAYVAKLGAGTTWAVAIDHVRHHGQGRDSTSLQFPIVPGYKNLTVGGTLSIGGGGFRSHTRGLQVDHVTELEIVTGTGEIHTANPFHNKDLFYATLGGGGLVGVITNATLTLVPDECAENKQLAAYVLTFTDQEPFLQAMLDPSLGEIFYEVQGNARPHRQGWKYLIKGSVDQRIISRQALQMRFPQAHIQRKIHAVVRSGRHGVLQSALYDYGLKLIRRWHTPHPWATLFLPIGKTQEFFSTQLERVHRDGLGNLGFVTLVPTRHYQRPYSFLQLPPGEYFGSFGIFYMPKDRARAVPLFEHLAAVLHDAESVGGKAYLSDAIPITEESWRRYYGAGLHTVISLKTKYDPNFILKTLHPSQDRLFSRNRPSDQQDNPI